MTINSKRWLGTLPGANAEYNQEGNKLDHDKWISSLPKKNKNSTVKKYSFAIIIFFVGLVFVSTIKNQTRNLQKEIGNLKASISNLKRDLHKTVLEHEVITSPENISRLANEYLEFELTSYKKSQIKQLNDQNEKVVNLLIIKEDKNQKGLSAKVKLKIAKKIEQKKTEIRKLQELYSNPKSIPVEVRTQVAKQIEEKKVELNRIYKSPKDIITLERARKWGTIQVVKAFLGIPIIPGR